MSKREVLVNTAFFEKLSCGGKNVDFFKKVVSDLEFNPVFHPYIASNELDMYPYFNKLVDEGFVRVADYKEFLEDEEDKVLYETYFVDIHNALREYLELAGGKKQLEKLSLPVGQTVFTYRRASMSLGDVHMILMAFFLKLPIILTEDADIDVLRSITKRKMASESYMLDIYNAVDLLCMIANKENTSFSKDYLINIVKSIGERVHQSEIKQIWNSAHQIT